MNWLNSTKRHYEIMSSDNTDFWRSFSYPSSSTAVSNSGVVVTPERLRTFVTFFACVMLRAQTIGALKCFVARETDSVFEPVDHPLNRLLDYKPNKDTKEFNFFETLVHHLDVWGNFYAIKKRDRLGRYNQLTQISNPANVYPYYIRRGVKTLLHDSTVAFPGQLVYEVNRTDGQPAKTYPAKDILHVANISQNGIVGLSQIGMLKEMAGKVLSGQKLQADRFTDSAVNVSGIVSWDRAFGENEEEDVRQIRKKIEDIPNYGVAVLDEGLVFNQLTPMPLADAQFIESYQVDAKMICGWLHTPPHKVGLEVSTSYNSLEAQNSDFNSTAFRLGTRISKTLTSSLLPEKDVFENKLRVVFGYDTLFMADTKARAEFNNKMFSMGATPNTIMKRENWPMISEEDGGNKSFRPGNYVELNSVVPTSGTGANNFETDISDEAEN